MLLKIKISKKMEIKMNKLILILGFGVLASSAFAGNLEQNVENAHAAYKNAKAAGNLGKGVQTGKKFVTNEKSQNDLSHDARAGYKGAKGGVISPSQAESALKHAYNTNY